MQLFIGFSINYKPSSELGVSPWLWKPPYGYTILYLWHWMVYHVQSDLPTENLTHQDTNPSWVPSMSIYIYIYLNPSRILSKLCPAIFQCPVNTLFGIIERKIHPWPQVVPTILRASWKLFKSHPFEPLIPYWYSPTRHDSVTAKRTIFLNGRLSTAPSHQLT